MQITLLLYINILPFSSSSVRSITMHISYLNIFPCWGIYFLLVNGSPHSEELLIWSYYVLGLSGIQALSRFKSMDFFKYSGLSFYLQIVIVYKSHHAKPCSSSCYAIMNNQYLSLLKLLVHGEVYFLVHLVVYSLCVHCHRLGSFKFILSWNELNEPQ